MSKESTQQIKRKPKVIAAIPAYNEEKTVAAVILETEKYVDKIIIVDDGSTDHTAEIARRMGATVIQHAVNKGYGAAIISLLKKALEEDADIAVTLDADGQHDPRYIPYLTKPILENKADIVIGSRFLGKTKMPKYRKIGVKTITALSNVATKLNITDAQSGFRAYSKKALQKIVPQLSEQGMGISLQILQIANQARLKIAEVPITIEYNVEKPSKKNPLTHGVELVATIIRITALEQPLKYLGIPSVVLLMAGIIAAVQLIAEFNKTRYFSIPAAIISLGLTLLGAILATTALTFYTLTQILKKIEEMRNIGH